MMILQLKTESGHPIFRASSVFERRDLGSKGHGKKSTHFNENEGHIELLLRTVISVNQLSMYGAVADLRKELNNNSDEDSSEDSESSGTIDTEERRNEMTYVTPAIEDGSEGFPHRAAPPHRRTKCRLSLCIFSLCTHCSPLKVKRENSTS